ncbi:hypothetical protein [Erythrobacter donghaensis]|uniref:hypothetical protein n=1 Tax=Erythrobacter donghaensis TaxID=267135 RepID=UPI0012D9E5B6|nr:hypothetical protein [Erythrobacter donghaensis]
MSSQSDGCPLARVKDRRSPQFAAQIGSPGARLRGVPEGTSLTRWHAPSLGNSHQAQEVHMGIQVTLYQALRSVKVPASDAEKVVEDLESHIAMKITEANKELVGELKSQRWVLGFLLIVTTISASLGGYVAFILK